MKEEMIMIGMFGAMPLSLLDPKPGRQSCRDIGYCINRNGAWYEAVMLYPAATPTDILSLAERETVVYWF